MEQSFEKMYENLIIADEEDEGIVVSNAENIEVKQRYVVVGHSEGDCNVVYENPDKIVDETYGVWLRAPAKNANMNAGSRWLRNIADENKAWTSKSTSPEQSNTDHGRSGGQKDAKFMEIDGVVREFGVDNSAFTIKGHKNGI
ncbi:hypothetical protein AgCh_001463 [Apium graveolens]